MKRILVLLKGNINTDDRVQKEIDTFITLNYKVTLVVWNNEPIQYEKKDTQIIDIQLGVHKNPLGPLFTFLMTIAYWYQASRIIKKNHFDYIHCNDLDTLGVLYFLPKRYENLVIYDTHELFPERFPSNSIRKIVWNFIEKKLIKKTNTTICTELNRANYLKRKYNLTQTPYVINNFPKYQSIVPKDIKSELDIPPTKKMLCYHGRMDPDREIDVIIESLKYLPEDFILILIGYSSSGYLNYLEELIKKQGLNNRVILYGKVPASEILSTIAQCDVGIALYENSNINNYYCSPNKVFDYLMADVKVITNDYPSLRILSGYRFIHLISHVTPQALAESVKELTDDPSKISDSFKRRFSWESFNDIFGQIYC